MIPPKSNRVKDIDCDMGKYRRRHRVENFFCKIKHFRRIATRHDQTASSYAALVWVAIDDSAAPAGERERPAPKAATAGAT